jgi:hypothetical protein
VPLKPESMYLEVEICTEKLKKCKLPVSDETSAELKQEVIYHLFIYSKLLILFGIRKN